VVVYFLYLIAKSFDTVIFVANTFYFIAN